MRRRLLSIALPLLFCAATAAEAQVSFGVETPGVSIGINLAAFPTLVQVPGYPVYYDPQVSANYFFYDGLFWVFSGDTWYASAWYDGPWEAVTPEYVPAFVLRVPVRYYREPPVFFRGWSSNAPPRWGDHWGHDWEARHAGWDRWNHNAAPAPAPLPVYQRQYTGDRYPRAPQQQQALRSQNYHFQPRENVSRQAFAQKAEPAPTRAQATTSGPPPARTAQPRETRPSSPSTSPPTRNAQARPATPAGEARAPERSAEARPSGPRTPTRSAEARTPATGHAVTPPTQTAHAPAAAHPQAKPAREPQVAHQAPAPRAPETQARAAPPAKAPERAAQRAPTTHPPAREAHAAPGNAPSRNAAAPQGKAAPSEARGGDNGAKRAEHDEKGRPQQQGNAGDKDERRGG